MTGCRIHTRSVFDVETGRREHDESYLYDGPVALAIPMASFDQDSYAFYEDGAEASSTQVGSTNSETTLDTDHTYQARLLIQEAGGADGTLKNIIWEYNHQGGGWTEVTTTSNVVKAVTGTVGNDTDTTQRIGGGTYDSVNAMATNDGTSANNAVLANYEVEGLLTFQIVEGDVSDGDEILLRIQGCDTFTRDADIDVNKAASARRVFVT